MRFCQVVPGQTASLQSPVRSASKETLSGYSPKRLGTLRETLTATCPDNLGGQQAYSPCSRHAAAWETHHHPRETQAPYHPEEVFSRCEHHPRLLGHHLVDISFLIRGVLPPREKLATCGDMCGLPDWARGGRRVLLASGMSMPRIVLTVLSCTAAQPTTKNYPAQRAKNIKVWRL